MDPLLEPVDDPLAQIDAWLEQARRSGATLAEAVCLATADSDGAPSARMVLYRGIHEGRLSFYTNYDSRKARELEANPRAALVFYWTEPQRQIRVEGNVSRLSAELSDRYFASRPRGSRMSAWASRQSRPVADRETLRRRVAEIEARFAGVEVPRPPHWGGYGLTPSAIEFWVGLEDRLHDRLRYERYGEGWSCARLQP